MDDSEILKKVAEAKANFINKLNSVMDKSTILELLQKYYAYKSDRSSFFINGKRYTFNQAICMIKNNISDKCNFNFKHKNRTLPWWVGDWRYNMNQPKYTGKGMTEKEKLFHRCQRENIYITTK